MQSFSGAVAVVTPDGSTTGPTRKIKLYGTAEQVRGSRAGVTGGRRKEGGRERERERTEMEMKEKRRREKKERGGARTEPKMTEIEQ